MAAFVVGGVSMAAGIGTASAQSAERTPNAVATCLLPLLPCEDPTALLPDLPELPALPIPNPLDHRSNAPAPDDSPPSDPADGEPRRDAEPEHPWKPVDEDERRVPNGHPETGGGGLAPGEAVWPFTVGGAALLAGAGLTGVALRRRKGA
ncbi:hypothetical protein ABZ297_19375 [Nonomuraea sp. NPDC005983]|uniref:hypothetical protein n=1 Tax=Nonomuraea sp. NPDC005983 TaxID=3155595 RepID=UPI0033BD53E4